MKILNILYKDKRNGEYLRLIKYRKSDINTFLRVDKNNVPILEKNSWSTSKQLHQKEVIVNGFKYLERAEQVNLFDEITI